MIAASSMLPSVSILASDQPPFRPWSVGMVSETNQLFQFSPQTNRHLDNGVPSGAPYYSEMFQFSPQTNRHLDTIIALILLGVLSVSILASDQPPFRPSAILRTLSAYQRGFN